MATNSSASSRPAISSLLLTFLGVWLTASPYVLGFAWYPEAWWNAVVIGLSLLILAMIRFANPRRFEGLRWTAVVLGGWMILSPFVADYYHLSPAFFNALITGILVLIIALPPRNRPHYVT